MNQSFINNSNQVWQLIGMAIILVPVAMILIKQKGSNIHFQALAAANIFFFISACSMNKNIPLPTGLTTFIQSLASIMHAPLTLAFLLYFTNKDKEKKAIRNSIAFVVGIIAVSLFFADHTSQLTLNLMLLGTIPVFIFGSSLFIQHTINGVYENKNGNKAFLLSTIVFGYGSYFLLHVLNIVSPEKHASDIQGLFGMITILSSCFVSLGIGLLNQQKKKGVVMEESKEKKLDAGFAQWDNFNFY